MTDIQIELHDTALRLYHPPVLMENRKYVALVEKLCEIYPAQRREADAFEFSLSPAQTAKITPQMTSVADLFENDVKIATRRVFRILATVLEVMDAERIETFDHILSCRVKPGGEGSRKSYDEFTADRFIEEAFFKKIDFSPLAPEGTKPASGASWFYEIGEKSLSIKIEPYPEDRETVFAELFVQHPPGNISLGDVRAAVEDDLRYLHEDVVRFLQNAFDSRKR